MKNQKRDANISRAINHSASYMRSSLPLVILALILAALGAGMTIAGPNKLGEIANLISEGLATKIDLSAVARVGIFLAALYALSALFSFIQHYIMANVTLDMSYRLRTDLSEKINRLPQKFFNNHAQGDVLSLITNDVSTLQQGLTNSLPTIISAATQFIGCLIMMFITEWRLALSALLITLLGMAAMMLIMSRSQRFFTARQESLGELNGYIEEMYSGHEVVRISRADDAVKAKFDSLNEKVYDANWRSQFLSGVMQPIMNIVGNVAYVAVCVLGSILALNGSIDFGVIVSFIFYVRLFTSPLTQIAQGMTNLQTASASANRIFTFLGSEELSDESEKPETSAAVRGKVDFDHVRFAYPGCEAKPVIKDFSAHVEPGEKVAIVGPTGAGKTTMVNLLMRFFEINSGSIKIDGAEVQIDAADIPLLAYKDLTVCGGAKVKTSGATPMGTVPDGGVFKVFAAEIDAEIVNAAPGYEDAGALSVDPVIADGYELVYAKGYDKNGTEKDLPLTGTDGFSSYCRMHFITKESENKPVDPVAPKPELPPKSGDTTKLMLWGLLLVTGCAAAAAVTAVGRKKKRAHR